MPPEALALERRNDRHMDAGRGRMDGMRVWMAKLCFAPHRLGMNAKRGMWGMDGSQSREMSRYMWYVMQVVSGQENRIALMVEHIVSGRNLGNCFVPKRRLRKKFHGEWHETSEKLFPGYVFVITEQPQTLYEEVKKIPALTKLLGRNGEYFTPLSKADVQTIEKLQNKAEEGWGVEAEISKIAVGEGKRVKILSGPLQNLEGQVRKINLHKRIAEVEMDFMGSKTVIYLGIEPAFR